MTQKKEHSMDTLDKEIVNDKLTQADLIKLMLHNAQHMATREEVKADIREVKQEMSKMETSLKQDISKMEASLRKEISKIDNKFDKMQWLIVATMLTILLKDYIFSFIK